MKTNTILTPSACLIVCAALFSGCYQTPEIDSQPEQAPKIVVDAKSEYKVSSTSSDPVIFSISANTPWYIENDAEDWCTPSPGTSATSSLTEDITVTIDDNTADKPRTATLTITAEGVEEPVLVKITQNAKSNLEVVAPSGMIDGNGGFVEFTVTSDLDWKVTSPQTWISFEPASGTGSKTPVTVKATAGAGTSMRTATVRIETEEDFRTISIVQDGPVILDFAATDEAAKTFSYSGETKTFRVEASMFWKITCNDSDIEINPKSGTASEDISVTLPYSKYINDKTYTITLESDDPDTPMESKTLVLTQESFAAPVNGASLEGFTLSADGGTAYVKSKDKWKYGTFTWTFSNVNLTSGYFKVDNSGDNSTYLRINFGKDIHSIQAGYTNETPYQINGYSVHWGFENGYNQRWNFTGDFTENTYPEFSELKTMKLVLQPTQRSGGYNSADGPYTILREIYINDVKVFTNRGGNGWDNTGDIWQEGGSHTGFQYQFGICEGSGSITIDSFEYTPIE